MNDLPLTTRAKCCKLAESPAQDFFKSLPIELMLQMPAYGHSLWILNALLRLNKQYVALLSAPQNLALALYRFKDSYLAHSYALIRERLEAIQLLKLIDQVITTYRAVLAGGYVLRTLCKESFDGADIDVFVPYVNEIKRSAMRTTYPAAFNVDATSFDPPEAIKAFKAFYRGFYKSCIEGAIERGEIVQGSIRDELTYVSMKHLKYVATAETPSGVKLQFVFVEVDEGMSMAKTIERDFDFSFCKCLYNGRKVKTRRLIDQLRKVGTRRYVAVEDGKERITLEKGWKLNAELLRELKYAQRGFCFIDAKRAQENCTSPALAF